MTESSPSAASVASGLYWRKSRWNGAACVPVVLTATRSGSRGTLSMRDADGGGFSVDGSHVQARWSRWGTMTLRVDGTTYDVVGAGSGISKPFTPAQREELAAAEEIASDAGSWAWASTGLSALDVGKVLTNTKPWKQILPTIGAALT